MRSNDEAREMRLRHRLLIAIIALSLSGCLTQTSTVKYGSDVVTIELACENPFEVRENAESRRIEVSSSETLGEIGRSFWKCHDPGVSRLSKAELYHRAAREFLRRSNREHCEITNTVLLWLGSYEFRYRCSASAK